MGIRFLRSLAFSVMMIVSTIITALLLILALPLSFWLRSRIARFYAAFVIGSLKTLCGIDYQVRGREHTPKGAAIIFAKHQSAWETYALQLLFPPQVWVLKRELMRVPFFGWGMAALKPIAIDRGAGRKAIKQVLDQGQQRLDAGIWVTIFPEGTRVAPGQKKRWGLGGAALAEHTSYSVVPVAHNAGEFWGRRSFIKRPGTIQVIIGAPIETRGRSAAEINRAVQEWMDITMTEISAAERRQPEHTPEV